MSSSAVVALTPIRPAIAAIFGRRRRTPISGRTSRNERSDGEQREVCELSSSRVASACRRQLGPDSRSRNRAVHPTFERVCRRIDAFQPWPSDDTRPSRRHLHGGWEQANPPSERCETHAGRNRVSDECHTAGVDVDPGYVSDRREPSTPLRRIVVHVHRCVSGCVARVTRFTLATTV